MQNKQHPLTYSLTNVSFNTSMDEEDESYYSEENNQEQTHNRTFSHTNEVEIREDIEDRYLNNKSLNLERNHDDKSQSIDSRQFVGEDKSRIDMRSKKEPDYLFDVIFGVLSGLILGEWALLLFLLKNTKGYTTGMKYGIIIHLIILMVVLLALYA